MNGAPFLDSLSQAMVTNNPDMVQAELEKFGESFRLIDQDGRTVVSIGKMKERTAVLAVPPGGQLVVSYER